MPAGCNPTWCCSATTTPTPGCPSGMWYAGSTDTFSFADEPDQAKGIVVLDTDSGECRHVPLTGLRPLVTLEPVFALGLSPAEVQERVLERAAGGA